MIQRQVDGWYWNWKKTKFLVLIRPNGRMAAVISFNKKLGWMWCLRRGPSHKVTDVLTAIRQVLEAFDMKEKTREGLFAVVRDELVRLGKIDALKATSSEIEGE